MLNLFNYLFLLVAWLIACQKHPPGTAWAPTEDNKGPNYIKRKFPSCALLSPKFAVLGSSFCCTTPRWGLHLQSEPIFELLKQAESQDDDFGYADQVAHRVPHMYLGDLEALSC